MSFHVGDKVSLKRDIFRAESKLPYARAGETGDIRELFQPPAPDGHNVIKTWYAKVMMHDTLKTFRLTSLQRVDQ